MAWVAVITLIGGVIVTVGGWLLHQRDAGQQREMDRIENSLKAAWTKIDDLKEDRLAYLTRADHDKWRIEFRQDLKDLEDRLIARFNESLKGK
jgi:hypothetical protein